MTEEYKNELISRISKLNYTSNVYIKRTLMLCLVCLFSLFCGYFLHFLPIAEAGEAKTILSSHLCGFFGGLRALDCIRAVISFTLPDLVSVLAITFFGYTMMSGMLGRLTLFCVGAKFGLCASLFYDLLIKNPIIYNGATAFALFAVCKAVILTALVFSVLRSEDFSYSYTEVFTKNRRPYLSPCSREYLKTMLSTAGFTAIINTIYLVFQSVQGYTPL
ncbi:MAG: hypothetical protein E7671_04850 [Ruminococcaceae bacterium]|nr:hypothetical protein [Oscillospiraceae bacterium]